MYGAAESWALTGSQTAQLETFHNSCMRRMMGQYRGTGGPSTAELLDVTGQMPIAQLLIRHRVRWLGHEARKLETTIVNQLLHGDSVPGRPRPVGCPHYTWMDGAMQDLNALGPRLQLASSETGRSWRWTGICGGGLPVGASLVGAYRTSLLSFSFSFSLKVFSNSSLVVFQFFSPHSFVFVFVCMPWSEACSARVTSLR